jgi:hypothetical protein
MGTHTYHGHVIVGKLGEVTRVWQFTCNCLGKPVMHQGAYKVGLRKACTAVDQAHAALDVLLAIRDHRKTVEFKPMCGRDGGTHIFSMPLTDLLRHLPGRSKAVVRDGVRRCKEMAWLSGGPEFGYRLTPAGEFAIARVPVTDEAVG